MSKGYTLTIEEKEALLRACGSEDKYHELIGRFETYKRNADIFHAVMAGAQIVGFTNKDMEIVTAGLESVTVEL